MQTYRNAHIRTAAVGAALVAALGLAACGFDDGGDTTTPTPGASTGATGSGTTPDISPDAPDTPDAAPASPSGEAADGIDGFAGVAAGHGYTCAGSEDPFLHRPAVTCSPADGDMQRATFVVFDRAEIGSGSDAARAARESVTGTGGIDTSGLPDFPGREQLGDALDRLTAGPQNFRPVDADTVAGYCIDSQGTCGSSGLDAMGLTLG